MWRIFKMQKKLEQCPRIKFCFNLKKSASDTYNMIWKGFEEHALSCTQVFKWYTQFNAGRTELGDNEKTKRPSMSITPETIVNASLKIIIRQFTTLLQNLELTVEHVTKFWARNWGCIVLQQNLFHNCWSLIKSNIELMCALSWEALFQTIEFFYQQL